LQYSVYLYFNKRKPKVQQRFEKTWADRSFVNVRLQNRENMGIGAGNYKAFCRENRQYV
jgi:hypothetical protein